MVRDVVEGEEETGRPVNGIITPPRDPEFRKIVGAMIMGDGETSVDRV
jgi:hypothetical protein